MTPKNEYMTVISDLFKNRSDEDTIVLLAGMAASMANAKPVTMKLYMELVTYINEQLYIDTDLAMAFYKNREDGIQRESDGAIIHGNSIIGHIFDNKLTTVQLKAVEDNQTLYIEVYNTTLQNMRTVIKIRSSV